MLWHVNYKCASFWRRKKTEEKKEGEEEADEEEEGRGYWKRRGATSVQTNVGRGPGLCRLQKNVPTSALRL